MNELSQVGPYQLIAPVTGAVLPVSQVGRGEEVCQMLVHLAGPDREKIHFGQGFLYFLNEEQRSQKKMCGKKTMRWEDLKNQEMVILQL